MVAYFRSYTLWYDSIMQSHCSNSIILLCISYVGVVKNWLGVERLLCGVRYSSERQQKKPAWAFVGKV